MTEPDTSVRSFGCQYACGNPMDVVVTQFKDSSTLFLCYPCFVLTAVQVADALTGESAIDTSDEERELAEQDEAPSETARARRGRHNAPAGTDDLDLIEAFDSRVYEDELPDEFK